MYKLGLSDEAARQYRGAEKPLAQKLAKCFARLEANPRGGNNVKALRGPLLGHWRYRVGDHRVVYSIDEAKQTVTVVAIAHRREVYE